MNVLYLRVECIFWCCHRDMKCNCLTTWQITPEGRYVMPYNEAIAFHISMTAPKYALNPYNCTHYYSLSESIFENDREKNK